MWEYLWASLGLAALCAGWVLFQRWLERVDPDGRRIQDSQDCGRGCSGKCDEMETSRQGSGKFLRLSSPSRL